MYEGIPDWLIPFLTPYDYSPNRQFLRDLDPQSRVEAILKFGFLELLSTYEGFLVSDGEIGFDNFIDSNDDIMIWTTGQIYEVTVDNEPTPIKIPAVIHNNPIHGTSELFVKHYSIDNNSGSQVSRGSDKVYSVYISTYALHGLR